MEENDYFEMELNFFRKEDFCEEFPRFYTKMMFEVFTETFQNL